MFDHLIAQSSEGLVVYICVDKWFRDVRCLSLGSCEEILTSPFGKLFFTVVLICFCASLLNPFIWLLSSGNVLE